VGVRQDAELAQAFIDNHWFLPRPPARITLRASTLDGLLCGDVQRPEQPHLPEQSDHGGIAIFIPSPTEPLAYDSANVPFETP
jgi:hypothetical protein